MTTETTTPPLITALHMHLMRSARATLQIAESPATLQQLTFITTRILNCFSSGGKILICGNGGSASDAQHIAAEFVGRYKRTREGLPAIALTTDTSVLTAVANDFDYSRVFSRQVNAIGLPHDVLWAISTSGCSSNVLQAMMAAKAKRMRVIGFTRGPNETTPFGELCDDIFCPPVTDTAILQQVHMMAAHAICDAVETELAQ
jgi:D-sedoheptulose 7-phosphate isomerase